MNFDFIYHFLADLGYTHPLHPTLTHLTIGLVIAAVIFRAIALLPAYGKYGQTARHCSTLAFLAIFPTVVLGLMDWAYYYGANWMFPIKMKMILAGALMVLLLLAIILNLKLSKGSGALLVIYLLAFLTVIGLGYFGGEIVYGKRSAREVMGNRPPKNRQPSVPPPTLRPLQRCKPYSGIIVQIATRAPIRPAVWI